MQSREITDGKHELITIGLTLSRRKTSCCDPAWPLTVNSIAGLSLTHVSSITRRLLLHFPITNYLPSPLRCSDPLQSGIFQIITAALDRSPHILPISSTRLPFCRCIPSIPPRSSRPDAHHTNPSTPLTWSSRGCITPQDRKPYPGQSGLPSPA